MGLKLGVVSASQQDARNSQDKSKMKLKMKKKKY
jgi:hypothetical protein